MIEVVARRTEISRVNGFQCRIRQDRMIHLNVAPAARVRVFDLQGGDASTRERCVFSTAYVEMRRMPAIEVAGLSFASHPSLPHNSGIGLPLLTMCTGRPLKSLIVVLAESMPRWW